MCVRFGLAGKRLSRESKADWQWWWSELTVLLGFCIVLRKARINHHHHPYPLKRTAARATFAKSISTTLKSFPPSPSPHYHSLLSELWPSQLRCCTCQNTWKTGPGHEPSTHTMRKSVQNRTHGLRPSSLSQLVHNMLMTNATLVGRPVALTSYYISHVLINRSACFLGISLRLERWATLYVR